MKRNLYTESIEKIKAPERLINKSISQLSTASAESEVIIMKPKPRKAFKIASVIAATLVILIVLGAVTFIDTQKTEHPFILTVGAEEITPDAYIKFGDTVNIDNSSNYILHGYINENHDFVQTDNYADIMWVRKEFNVEINCEGENIESITYKAINGYLSYYKYYPGLIEATPLTTDEVNKYNATGSYNNFKKASDCTYEYNNQPKSANPDTENLEKPSNGVDGSIPLRISFSFDFKEGEYVVPMGENYHIDTNPTFQKEFNEHADEFGLEVRANFKDGTSTTKTLKFKCESNDNRLYLCAIEDIS